MKDPLRADNPRHTFGGRRLDRYVADFEPGDEEEGAAAERPAWLPENFETPEALADSYREAQRKITEETNARKALEQNYNTLNEQVEQLQQQQQPQYDQSQAHEQWMEAYEADPIGTIAALTQAQVQQQIQQFQQQFQQQSQPQQQSQAEIVAALAEDTLRQNFADWDQYKPKIVETIQQRPYLMPDDAVGSPQKTADALALVYNVVKSNEGQSAPPPPSNADMMRTMKINAQSAQGAEGRPAPTDPQGDEWARILAAGQKTDGRYW